MENTKSHHRDTVHLNHRVSGGGGGGGAHSELTFFYLGGGWGGGIEGVLHALYFACWTSREIYFPIFSAVFSFCTPSLYSFFSLQFERKEAKFVVDGIQTHLLT